MNDLEGSFAASASGMRAQATRLRHVTENIANADTPGYRRKMVPFQVAETGALTTVQTGRVQLDRSELPQVHDPAHPLADDSGNYEGSNVNTVMEIADSREAQRSYEANLRMFDQARKMSSDLLSLIKR